MQGRCHFGKQIERPPSEALKGQLLFFVWKTRSQGHQCRQEIGYFAGSLTGGDFFVRVDLNGPGNFRPLHIPYHVESNGGGLMSRVIWYVLCTMSVYENFNNSSEAKPE